MTLKCLTVQVRDWGMGYPTPRVFTPKGEDISGCITKLTPLPLEPGTLAAMEFEALYTTDPQHMDPVLERLVHAINESCKRHLKEMKQTYQKGTPRDYFYSK